MSDPGSIKRLSASHAYLLSAAKFVSGGVPGNVPATHVPFAEVESALNKSSLIDCIDALAHAGSLENPRAGFWRDLERATEALGLPGRSATYCLRFLVAVGNK
jgi:hypothetical protein